MTSLARLWQKQGRREEVRRIGLLNGGFRPVVVNTRYAAVFSNPYSATGSNPVIMANERQKKKDLI
jgi:hypothetical protein